LAKEILPQLRYSRISASINTIGRSDEEIAAQYKEDPTQLSIDELLYAATKTDNVNEKEDIYKTAVKQYPNDYRAYNNLAALALAKGDVAAAKQYAQKATSLGSSTPEAQANLGLISLIEGDVQGAERQIAKASGSENVQSALGALNIAKGNYAQADKDFNKQNTNTAALAQILNKDYEGATSTLDKVANPNGMTDYLRAIVAARRGNKFAANSYLKEALQKDPSLKEYAEKDLELSLLK
jgi:Flp pilus assembly protein TadD